MPKLDISHRISRIINRIEQLERHESIEAREINALLTKEQQAQLKSAWSEQQAIRKHYKIKQKAEQDAVVWKTIREVRLEIYRQALAELNASLDIGMEELKHQREVKAARIFLDAYFKASDEGKDPMSAANIALRRNHFQPLTSNTNSRSLNARDKEIREMEERLRAKHESEMTDEEREQWAMLREIEKGSKLK